jgi:S1-C subfamily serine protease
MAEQRMGGRTPLIAVSLAVVAVITVVIALIVVVSRKPAPGAQPALIEDSGPLKHRVTATNVVRLDRDTLESATDASGVAGVKVTDAELRTELGLEPTDIITAISGRAVKRQFDVYDALLGASTMNATMLYVDLIREGKPALLRWELDGTLRAARTAATRQRTGSIFPPLGPTPAVTDPLIDTIKKIDDLRYEVPGSTVDAVFADPMAIARGARVVPAFKQGQPNGFKVYAVRPTSIFAAIGLHNGDTVVAINGQVLDRISTSADLFGRLKGVDSIRIDLERRGRPEVLEITVTR